MFGSIISFLASAASALSTWLRGQQQAKDEASGASQQQLADSTAILSVAKASVLTANDIDQRSTDDLRAVAEKWRAES